MLMWLVFAQLDEVPSTDVFEDPSSSAMATWAGVAAIPLVAGIVQIAVGAGLPIRAAGLLALVLGVAGGVAAGYTTNLAVFTGLVQGATVGLAAHGLWLTMSSKINTEG
jgi:hypothetical protein